MNGLRPLALAIMLAVGGCARDEHLSEEPAQAAIQIQSWVPVGTLLADAQHLMEQHHFACSVMTNSNFGDLKAANYLYCDRRVTNDLVAPITVRRWQVALVLSDGKISALRVTTGLIGP